MIVYILVHDRFSSFEFQNGRIFNIVIIIISIVLNTIHLVVAQIKQKGKFYTRE